MKKAGRKSGEKVYPGTSGKSSLRKTPLSETAQARTLISALFAFSLLQTATPRLKLEEVTSLDSSPVPQAFRSSEIQPLSAQGSPQLLQTNARQHTKGYSPVSKQISTAKAWC